MSSRSFRTDPERLEELIEEATVDCYDEEEQHSGLLTMIEDEVVFPFDAKVIGEIVQITGMA
jgi:Calcium binding